MIETAPPRSTGRLPIKPPTPDYRGLLETCTDACVQTRYVDTRTGRLVWGVVHDPMAHSTVCSSCLVGEANAHYIFRTGPLTVDFRAQVIDVDGEPVPLTEREWQMIECLALAPGALTSYRDLVIRIWGPDTWETEVLRRRNGNKGTSGVSRLAAVNVARLRVKLGRARDLIETVTHRGLRLRVVPPEGES